MIDDDDRDGWDNCDWDSFIDEYHCTDYWVDTDSLMDTGLFEDEFPIEDDDEEFGDCG